MLLSSEKRKSFSGRKRKENIGKEPKTKMLFLLIGSFRLST